MCTCGRRVRGRVATTLLVILLAACGRGVFRGTGASPQLVERVIAARRTTGAPPPLLVLLHGLGSNENDLASLAGTFDARFEVVSLRAPRPWRGGFAWFPIEWRSDGTIVVDPQQALQSIADLDRWLAGAPTRLGADPRHVYLLGFSQGAMMSLAVLRTAPERVAGVVALSGRFDATLFDQPPDRRAMARVALFVGHGTADELLPVTDGRTVRDAFTPLVPDTTYREYAMSHAIGTDELHDVASWLTERLDRDS
jgi:phospholipase/carboxylesterase